VSDIPDKNGERVVGAQELPDEPPGSSGMVPIVSADDASTGEASAEDAERFELESVDPLDVLLTEEDLAEAVDESKQEVVVRPGWLRDMPYWALSGVLHIILLFAIVDMIVSRKAAESEKVAVRVSSKRPPEPFDPKKKRDIVRKLKIPQPKLPQIPVVQKKIEEFAVEIPKGTDLLRQSDFHLDARFFNEVIGIGGGAAGAYGERWGKGSLRREGGGAETESAVRAALEWLVRHQSPNGSWQAKGFIKHCKKRSCCNKNTGRFGIGNAGDGSYDVGVTGLAVLAFTGAGNSHRAGTDPRFVKCLRRALAFIISKQTTGVSGDAKGRIGTKDHHKAAYEHAIATMALGELLILSGDRLKLVKPVTAAVDYCLRSRNPGKAWRYGYRDGSNDASVTGWMILALKTGKIAKLNIAEGRYHAAFEDAITYFQSLTNEIGRAGYIARGRERHDVPTMTSVSVLCRLFAGEARRSKAIRGGVDQLLASLPAWRGNGHGVDFYYWYYATYAAFQVGGAMWSKWNAPMKKSLLSSQRRGGCEDGSWDAIGTSAIRAGRVYSTAMGAMTLEVYYRFARTKAGLGFLNE
jgi:hypothetical protein